MYTLVYDFETSGLNPFHDDVIEIGCKCLETDESFSVFKDQDQFIFSLSSKGLGKRSSAYEYRISNRGGKGITGILTTPKNGNVVYCFVIVRMIKL